ncbi:MAG: hypothetical protein HYY32_00710 [Chloroflexi bacterium]|nr:hypothetical protein [Chloroflexota bacterium]
MEKAGIPTVSITRKGFEAVVGNAFAGLGFSSDAAQYVLPMETFLVGSDLAPVAANMGKIIDGLTSWESRADGRARPVPRLRIEGGDYRDAFQNMNLEFLRNGWGDGLPLLPPTETAVKWILAGTDLPPDAIVGAVLPRGGIATTESLAVCLAMAGGRPEYMPVLVAAVQAMTQSAWNLQHMSATTCSVYPAVIVSGPIARQIRLNSGYGLLGPSSRHPAGASIGRAIRLVLQDIGGATPGSGTMATFGGMRYTNAVFAEDEEGLPRGWRPLGAERGFTGGSDVVTVLPAASATNIVLSSADATTREGVANQYLRRIAAFMRTPNKNAYSGPRGKDMTAGVVLLGRGFVKELAVTGWRKDDVKAFLWEQSKLPWSVAEATGLTGQMTASGFPEREPVPLTSRPEELMIVVAGGEQSGHAYWMQVGPAWAASSKGVHLPARATWNRLLELAEKELGPMPVG